MRSICMNLCCCMHWLLWLVRTKYDANVKMSDRELFESLPLKDPWLDADMVTVFLLYDGSPKDGDSRQLAENNAVLQTRAPEGNNM